VQGTLYVQECGCEDLDTAFNPISFCGKHQRDVRDLFRYQGVPANELYRCGECGFQSRLWERLERHVYREHLGVDRP
jgi:hypothetical protein